MSFGKKIDIEPLGEGRWARIERAVFNADLDRIDEQRDMAAPGEAAPAFRWRAGAALVLAGALAAAFGAGTWRLLSSSNAGAVATRIETGSHGSRVEVGESTVDVAPESAVRVTGDDVHGVSVLLESGRVECDVPPRKGRPAFLVEACGVEVRVVGTHFSVACGHGTISVDVQHGQVEVISGPEHAFVPAGAHWPLPPQDVVTTTAPPAAPAVASRSKSRLDRPMSRPVGAETRASAPAAKPSASNTAQEQYEAASKLEATQPEDAVSLYRDLAKRGGPWGMNALYAEGRLEADRAHRDDAQRVLQEYLGRYPTGPNAEDAKRLLERLR
ncbi:MAG TPA: FecR domain-containing protein [Polyangiaceae bacterium]|jgi:hypothetical protein|nr:FecR domain-containing protein [Polyangiaceae bacterium]